MENQVAACREKEVTASYVNSGTAPAEVESIMGGLCKVVFISPEMLLCKKKWKELLRSPAYKTLSLVL